MPTNVLGTELKCCCRDPMTGFYRDGYCRTGPEDVGQHTVCVKATQEFLDFSVLDGNDLVTPHPGVGFSRTEAGRQVVRLRYALEKRARSQSRRACGSRSDPSSALEFVTLRRTKGARAEVGVASGNQSRLNPTEFAATLRAI